MPKHDWWGAFWDAIRWRWVFRFGVLLLMAVDYIQRGKFGPLDLIGVLVLLYLFKWEFTRRWNGK